jgi:hypothetical protein
MEALMQPLRLAILLAVSPLALADPGVDIGGHRHVDLSAATPPALPAGATVLAEAAPLPVPTAPCGDEAPGQIVWLGDDAVLQRQGESARLAAAGDRIDRRGDVLTLHPAHGAPLRFTDVVVKATKTRDGDATRFLFAGTLPGTRFWRLESGYQHDSPGSWLVDPDNGDAFFVHNGAGGAVLSADGHWLAVAELLNAPYQITLTELSATPAAVRIDCRVDDAGARGAFAACGFEADGGFRLSWRSETGTLAALRLVPGDAGRWRLERSAGTTLPALRCVALP